MSQTLPIEIFEQVLMYLPFEKVIYLSDYVSKRIYNPKQHNLQMYIINGNLEAIKWIYKNDIEHFDINESRYYYNNIIDVLACYGHLHVVKFLTEKKVGKASLEAMNSSARSGHLELVKYLHYNRTEGCTKSAMDCAAENGHLEVVKFLAENRKEGCSEMAIAWAAKNGHLDVVKYLHFSGIVNKVTTHAMDWAAENGHLEIVKFLHYNRTEGCTKCAIDWAAENGHFEVVKFLCENRTEGFTKLAMYWVDRKKFKDIYDYLKPKQIF
jgi:hypothetical protein